MISEHRFPADIARQAPLVSEEDFDLFLVAYRMLSEDLLSQLRAMDQDGFDPSLLPPTTAVRTHALIQTIKVIVPIMQVGTFWYNAYSCGKEHWRN